jgi:hypothetical protein
VLPSAITAKCHATREAIMQGTISASHCGPVRNPLPARPSMANTREGRPHPRICRRVQGFDAASTESPDRDGAYQRATSIPGFAAGFRA